MYRTPWEGDVEYVARNMRKADIEECEAGGFTPLDALRMSVASSIVCYTLTEPDTGLPGAILGVGPGFDPAWGAIWLLGTSALKKHRYRFLRNSKPVLHDLYIETGKDVFYNYTYVQNHVHHAWLRWLGFTFIRKVPLPPHGSSFRVREDQRITQMCMMMASMALGIVGAIGQYQAAEAGDRRLQRPGRRSTP
jgi:hypothetical protein